MTQADVEQQLATAGQDRIELGHLQRRIDGLGRQLSETEERMATARAAADQEQRDVDKLEHLSLSQLVAKLRGSHDQDLERERAEAYRAQLDLQNQQQVLQALRRERDQRQVDADRLADAPARYAEALNQKEQLLADTDPAAAEALHDVAERRAALGAQKREIGEARQAVDDALQSLAVAAAQLDDADGWSGYDTFFGGGALSSSLKHDKMDAAAQAMAAADDRLRRVSAEIADVAGLQADLPTLQLDGFDRFVDVWFDNIFTDLDVRDRIKTAVRQVADVGTRLNTLGDQLRARDTEVGQRLQQCLSDRDQLLNPAAGR